MSAEPVPPASLEERRHLRWLFVGQGPMGAAALAGLLTERTPVAVVTAEPPDDAGPVSQVAAAHRLEVHRLPRLGHEPARRWPGLFADLDVAVSACWGEKLRPGALLTPAHGWLNLHPSALPAWRGTDPVGWQLLAHPSTIGCTVHRMTDGLDDGPVVAQGRVEVRADDDRATLLRRSGTELGRLAASTLARLARGQPLEEWPQDDALATWCPPPGVVPSLDPRSLRAHTAERIARAFSPDPGVAVVGLGGGERFAVTGLGPSLGAGDVPGAVARAAGGHVALACRDRWLRGVVRGPSGAAAHASRPSVTRLGEPSLPPPPD